MSATKISLVIPVFNEEGNLRPLLEAIQAVEFPEGYELLETILIDDGSTDSSPELMRELAEKNDRLICLLLERNFGQTSALSAGFDQAKGDLVICLDADLQNDPADIPKMIAKLKEGYDLISGWRRDRQDPPLRTVLSKFANRLIGKTTGLHLHDYGCTLKIYKKKHLDKIKLYGEMHRFIPIYMQTVGAKVCEVPVSHAPRTWGVSKYGLNRTFKVLLDLMVIRFLNKYSNRPIYLFGSAGFLSLGVSFVCGFSAVFRKLIWGESLILTPLPTMTLFSFFFGIMFILMGMLAELLMRVYYESQNKSTYLLKEIVESSDESGKERSADGG
jgi:glycosyltransferase involved in cell wall biosynthesis